MFNTIFNRGKMAASFPKKRIAAGALIFNGDKILIVKPEYKDYWSFPGGVIESFESPSEGLKREVKEEVGLEVQVVKPFVIEYLKRLKKDKKDESLQFLFLCKLAKGEKFSNIDLAKGEISDYKFLPPKEAMKMISKRSAKRLKAGLKVLKNNGTLYLESKY